MAVAATTLALACCLAAVRADGLGVFTRALDKCGDDPDLYSCLKLKTVALLDRALAVDTLPVTDYLTIRRDPAAPGGGGGGGARASTEGELEAALPRDHAKRSLVLDQMLEERVARYLDTRTIQLSMPAHVFEAGRKKKDKGGMLMMAAAAMGGMMLQMAMGKIALIAGKALLIGKVALLLSAIVGLKKLVGSGGGDSHPQVVYAPAPEHHGGWGRSLEATTEPGTAHDVVYNAYRPQS